MRWHAASGAGVANELPGDFNGDRCVDLLTRVASTGNLNLYRGNCAGSFSGATINVGTGWGVFNWLW